MGKKSTILMGLAMIVGSFCASAQEKGDMAAGINLGVGPCLEKGISVTNFGIGAKFQYSVLKPLRLEAAFDYGFKSKGMDVMTVGVNAHYIFKISDKFGVYPLVGVGYARLGGSAYGDSSDLDIDWDDYLGDYYRNEYDDYDDYEFDDEDFSTSSNKFYFNVGLGAEYSFSQRLSAGLEIKYQYIKNFSRLPISVGVAYRF